RVLAQMLANAEARRRFEEQLRESEKRLRAIVDNLPDGAVYRIIQRPDRTVEMPYISAGIKRVLGFTAEEVMAHPQLIIDSIHEDDHEEYFRAAGETLRTLQHFEHELRHRTRDGSIKWVHVSSAPRRLDEHTLMADGVVIDVTTRKLTEGALRQNDILLRSVGDNLPNTAIYQVERNPQGEVRFTYVSKGIERILESPVEDF